MFHRGNHDDGSKREHPVAIGFHSAKLQKKRVQNKSASKDFHFDLS